MITETATVVAVDQDRVTVEAAIKSTCSSCQAQSDCGSGVISRAMAPKVQHLEIETPMSVKVGDTVQVGIPEAGLLSASVWLYLVPLLVFLLSAAGLTQLQAWLNTGHELLVVAGAAGITLAAFVGVSGHLKKIDKSRFRPVLLAVNKSSSAPRPAL
ncbi:SoxR reducing system RseC family protein [Salinimonas marina]|uniref:SoxR reducing system RseC family protein n=1 Tax=Salinimonas marina TaxID=2785918 RepID=A0A7S9DYW9_9ALTE|nr:SoxR reducing system RseC family protein [Salinimonas marina]QPG06519.1 SoxR reducing system RseC family protein [Salinimonas marina]